MTTCPLVSNLRWCDAGMLPRICCAVLTPNVLTQVRAAGSQGSGQLRPRHPAGSDIPHKAACAAGQVIRMSRRSHAAGGNINEQTEVI